MQTISTYSIERSFHSHQFTKGNFHIDREYPKKLHCMFFFTEKNISAAEIAQLLVLDKDDTWT